MAWLLMGILIAAIALRSGAPVSAEVREETPREAFKSGGERSEIVLREISETLKRIDARLERLEKFAQLANKDAAR